MASGMSNKVIGIAISMLLAGILLPIGLEQIVSYTGYGSDGYATTTGTMNATAIAAADTIAPLVATVIPIMAVVGIVLGFIAYQSNKKNSM